MRIGVISDIHSNLPALEAVLADVDREAPDELWCLGDIVGYGPHPNECVDLVREPSRALAVRKPRSGGGRRRSTSPTSRGDAGAAARWTTEELGEPQAQWLRGLRPSAERDGLRALPRQPARPGLGLRAERAGGADQHPRDDRAGRARRPQPRRARARLGRRRSCREAWRPQGTELDLSAGRWLLNPGLGRPAPRRRPARRLAPDRRRGRAGGVPARPVPDRGDAGRDPGARAPRRARLPARARDLERSHGDRLG